MRAHRRSGGSWLPAAVRTVVLALSCGGLLLAPGCANLWGFEDLTLAPEGGAVDAGSTGAPDAWRPGTEAGPDVGACDPTTILDCGGCGNTCDTTHSLGAACVLGAGGATTCQYSGCAAGFGDCNASPPDTDGCETSLTTVSNCGACGTACDTSRSDGATCADGMTCMYMGCRAGFADCDSTPPDTNGCETAVTANTCTVCGGTCDTVHSVKGACDMSGAQATCKYGGCAPGYFDCNTTPPDTNGCETSITTAANCGACGWACDAKTSVGASCSPNGCTYTGCAPGWANCFPQSPDTNGCESSLSSTVTCGGCKIACNTKTGIARCNGTTCSYACNDGFADCNAATAPDTDGCECATPGCCGANCQTAHVNGIGKSYYDCTPRGTYDAAQATAACEGSAGVGNCRQSAQCCLLSAVGVCVGNTAHSVCGRVGAGCYCWQYGGNLPGTVQTASASACTASCGASGDPTWN